MKIGRLQNKNVPLYQQLEQVIRSQIMTGELAAGQQILTEKDFADQYGVSTITARQAILNLAEQGLLIRLQGKGTFVTDAPMSIKNIMTLSVGGDINEVVPEGIASQQVKIIDKVRMTASSRIASILNINDTQDVVRIRRTRSDNGAVVSYIKNYVDAKIGKKINEKDLLAHTMIHVLRDKLGIPLKGGTQYIEAISADREVASALLVNISDPVLYLETIIFTKDRKPIEFVQTFYRSDRFKYTVNLDLVKRT